jgi:predicted amidophosphoribosyltransferase
LGTIQESLQDKEAAADAPPSAVVAQARTRQSLPAKGSCWYCEKPLDSVRRFCGKECADAFDEEAVFSADAIANPPR